MVDRNNADGVVAIDLGTTYFKFAVIDRTGEQIALHKIRAPVEHPAPGLWEMKHEQFKEVIRDGLHHLANLSGGDLSHVVAVTFSTQSNTFILLDKYDKPLTPLIIWADERARQFAAEAREINKLKDFNIRTGIPELNWAYAAFKLIWYSRNRPDLWARVARFCLISDYLTLWLTGEHITEAGTSGLLGWRDIQTGQYWPEVINLVGLDRAWLPTVVSGGTDIGVIQSAAARELGLPQNCRFIVGGLDQYAGAIGVGNIHSGLISETTGTVLATVRFHREINCHLASSIFHGPAFDPGSFYQMLFGTVSSNLLEWFQKNMTTPMEFNELCNAAANVRPGANGLRLVPEAEKGDIEHGFVGWSKEHTTGHAIRCILETVAFALAEQVHLICGTSLPIEIRAAGGAACSQIWLQTKADVLGIPFRATVCPSPTCLGAAMLAARSLGWGKLDDLSDAWIKLKPLHIPNKENHEFYSEVWRQQLLMLDPAVR